VRRAAHPERRLNSPLQCDRAAAAAQPGGRTARQALVLATTILASSLAFVDGSVVNVGLPAIQSGLKADPAALQWVINAYLLPLSALLLLGGAVGDRAGRKVTLVAGTALFGAASALCAAAWSLPVLLAARAIQGTAAAFVLPNSLAILGVSFSGDARGRAIGIWAAAGAAVGAVGPVLGGWLIDHFGWRTVFVINLPLAAAAIALALVSVHEPPRDVRAEKLDLLGSVVVTLGLGLLVWALTDASGGGGWTTRAWLSLAAGVLLLAVFVRVEAGRGAAAAMPLALFTSRAFVGLNLVTLILYGALSALLVLVPFVLIEAGHLSGTAAGAALLPLPVILALLSPATGTLAERIGARPLLIAGPLVVAAGFVVLTFAPVSGGYWRAVFPSLTLVSLGMSAVAAPLTTAVLSSAGPGAAGAASGFNSAVSRLGGTFATALMGGIFGARGAALTAAFHSAAFAGALASVASAAIAVVLVAQRDRPA
jgi:EmrB/QacA subfamily drug resistance transporter